VQVKNININAMGDVFLASTMVRQIMTEHPCAAAEKKILFS
jgi:hypothetical protein